MKFIDFLAILVAVLLTFINICKSIGIVEKSEEKINSAQFNLLLLFNCYKFLSFLLNMASRYCWVQLRGKFHPLPNQFSVLDKRNRRIVVELDSIEKRQIYFQSENPNNSEN